MKPIFSTLLFLFIVTLSFSQRINNQSNTNPPTTPNIRTMAEWEEIEAIVITWKEFKEVLAQVVKHAKKEVKVYVITDDIPTTIADLAFKGIDTVNVEFINQPYNSVWVRDYGATTIYGNHVDSVYLVDWIYNRDRPLDDSIPSVIAQHTGIQLYSTTNNPYDLVNTGGNFMSDGRGTAFSSKLVLYENGPLGDYNPTIKTEAQIDSIMSEFMGIDRYIKMDTLFYDGIHHIDMHMKLLNEETLLVGEYPQGVADGPVIEANLQYITDNFNSVFGTPYKVVRVPMPPDECGLYPNQLGRCPGDLQDHLGYYRTYTNLLFVNKTAIVPIYEEKYDTTALRIIQSELPGYNVVGIDCDYPIQSLGAIHCITKAVGTKKPLLISHQALRNTADTASSYKVTALIQHNTGIEDATIHFTTDTSIGFFSVPMSPLSNDRWQGYIPPQSNGKTVYYYIEATAYSGKQQVRPITAPTGFWQFKVDGTTSSQSKISNDWSFSVFPNPATDRINIPISMTKSHFVQLGIFDMLGRQLQDVYKGTLENDVTNFTLDVAAYPVGRYLVVLNIDGQVLTKKFSVNR